MLILGLILELILLPATQSIAISALLGSYGPSGPPWLPRRPGLLTLRKLNAVW